MACDGIPCNNAHMTKPSRPDMSWLGRMLRLPGRSQTALADYMGIDKGAVTRIIQGKRGLKVEEREAIDAYLNATALPGTELPLIPDVALRKLEAIPEYDGISSKTTLMQMLSAQSSGNDQEFVSTAVRALGDLMLETILLRIRDLSEAGAVEMIVAHREKPNLRFLLGLILALRIMPEDRYKSYERFVTACETIAEMKTSKPEIYNGFYRSALSIVGAAPTNLEGDRAGFGIIVTAMFHEIASGFDGRTRALMQTISDQSMRDDIRAPERN